MTTLSLQSMNPFYADDRSDSATRKSTSTGPAQVINSAELLRGESAVVIEHNGALYRLQQTKLGKLILTK